MILVFLMVFEIAVAMAIGFVLGRIYQIRRDELGRRVSHLRSPTRAQPARPAYKPRANLIARYASSLLPRRHTPCEAQGLLQERH